MVACSIEGDSDEDGKERQWENVGEENWVRKTERESVAEVCVKKRGVVVGGFGKMGW